MKPCIDLPFVTYAESVPAALDAAGARAVLAGQSAVLVKPNLVNDSPFPVTTPAACCEAIIRYIRACSDAAIVVGDGCGEKSLETAAVFERLGYTAMAKRLGVELLDLNHAPLRRLARPGCPVFPEMHLPEIAFTHFLFSVPVLKAHSLADMSGTLKNLVGLAPPRYYSGRYGSWKKAVFHGDMQQSIIDLNRYRTADLTLMDASVGLAEYHLGGPVCDPPAGRILAGFDPVAVDRAAAGLLGLDWRTIGHLA